MQTGELAGIQAKRIKNSWRFSAAKRSEKTQKGGFTSKVARILVPRIKRLLKETVTFL